MPFPFANLAILGMKQLSKPLAIRLKQRAKTHPFFRNKICIPFAQCKFLEHCSASRFFFDFPVFLKFIILSELE